MLKKYNQFLNESILQYLKGPTEEDSRKQFLSGNIFLKNYLKICDKLGYTLPSEDDIITFLETIKGNKNYIDIDDIYHASVYANKYRYSKILKYLFNNTNIIKIDKLVSVSDMLNLIHDNNYEYIKLLTSFGYNFSNLQEIHGLPLNNAIKNNNLDLVKLMVENGANLSLTNITLNPVYVAVCFNKSEILKYLLENDAYIDNIDGLLKIAKGKGYDEVYEILLSYNKTNESLLDNLKGPSEEEILNILNELDDSDKIIFIICKLGEQYYKYLPDKLTVNDDLYCSYKHLTSLPDNLTVNGDLSCYNNVLTSLPDNLTVNGDLYCSYNRLTTLPDNLTINGNLYCYNNKITSLPNNLTVDGDLNCSYNELTYLPDNLTVNGDLYCNYNKLRLKIPKTAKIKGEIINREYDKKI